MTAHGSRMAGRISSVVGASLLAALACAQAPATSPAGVSPQGAKPQQNAPVAMPPALKLGDRIAQAQQKLKVIPDVVIVHDKASFLDALAAWSPSRRFPILIDDGSPQAAEMIGQFVRGFSPTKVYTWTTGSGEAKKESGAATFASVTEVELRSAVNRAWDFAEDTTAGGFVVGLRDRKSAPPGVVVLDLEDEAWVAGAALAAHRGQPVIVQDLPRAVDGVFNVQQADELNKAIEDAAGGMGLEYSGAGDEVESVTITANCPAKIFTGGADELALSDRIGRPGKGVEMSDRWAWCGQIFGSAPRAAYVAMSSIFLVPRSAWMFDGYPDEGVWGTYDLTKAGDELREHAWQVEVMDKPNQSSRDWRVRASRTVDAGLMMVNTKGNADFFDLETGQCKPDDVPFLDQPSILHIIHSWSARAPGNRDLLAGRWMERGVYCYIGSVHEPYLQAFLPGSNIVKRVLAGGTLAAAVRHDKRQVWKIAYFGDPLIVLHSGMTRTNEAMPLTGANDLLGDLREMLKGERFAEGFRTLVMCGKDNELSRLASAIVRDKPTSLTPSSVELAILPMFREQKIDDLFAAYKLLDSVTAKRGDLRDALWLAAYQRLSKPTPELAQLLRANVRIPNIGRDAPAAASAIARSGDGDAAAKAWLEQLKSSLTDRAALESLNKALEQSQGAWGRD
ncbi:MAG: hypothetical protein U0640_03065 [Phycisphaerales bacterium]